MRSAATHDVVIVGGGPAGAATAIHLARLGRSVLLVDREAFPRPKPCGECLSPAAVAELERLGILDRVLELPHATLDGWRIVAPSGAAFEGTFPPGRPGVAVQRSLLDALLVEEARKAGAEILQARVVEPVTERGGAVAGVRLAPESGGHVLGARLTVGADGLRSVMVRRLGLVDRPPRLRKIALTAHVRAGGEGDRRGELQVLENGCIGFAHVGRGLANVTVVISGPDAAAVAGAKRESFDAALASSGRADLTRVDEVLATGPFDVPVRRAVVDGGLLVGDAAGYYDPFTGQGVYRALHGAALAAAAAATALERGDLSAHGLRSYERARHRAFGAGERLQKVIERVVSRPRSIGLAAHALRAAPRLANALVAVTGDIAPARSLLDPRLLRRP